MKNFNKYFWRFSLIVLYAIAIFAVTIVVIALLVLLLKLDMRFEEFFRYSLLFTGFATIVAICISVTVWSNGKSMPALYIYTDEKGVHELRVE
jgi:branched-subunit amino acid transport protein